MAFLLYFYPNNKLLVFSAFGYVDPLIPTMFFFYIKKWNILSIKLC